MSIMAHEDFYSKIKLLDNFQDISLLRYYQDVPADWVVIITDVVMSTKAIESGKYKDVNAVGALAIVAVLNTIKEIEIPFIFGGDGATLLIPQKFLNKVKDALLHTKNMAKIEYDLDLRVGVVTMQKILHDGHEIKLAKLAISQSYHQAIMAGSGVDYAEKLVKDPKQGKFYSLGENIPRNKADFSGFTCRWEDIPSKYGETLSIIIKVSEKTLETQVKQYSEIIKTIRVIYGDSQKHHPIHFEGLNLTFDPGRLSIEAKSMTGNIFQRWIYLSQVYIENAIGKWSGNIDKSVNGFSMRNHRNRMIISTDYKKFDGSLKMVISGTSKQRIELENYLDKLVSMNLLNYGIHTSDRALLTCLVFEGTGREVHFVDSADGGYALAAKKLKGKIAKI